MEFIEEDNRIYGVDKQGNIIAEITFPKDKDGYYNINHTFVDESLRGQNIGKKLVEMALEKIRKNEGEVRATCSYAKHYLEKNGIDK